MSSFNEIMELVNEVIGYKYLMAFILIFTVSLGIIDVTGIFRRKDDEKGMKKTMWKLQLLMALAITFMVLYNPTTADFIFRAVTEFTNWILVAFMGIVIFYTFTKVVVFKGGDAEEEVSKKIAKYAKWTASIIGFLVFLYFLGKYAPQTFEYVNPAILVPIGILFLIFGVPALWIYYHSFRGTPRIDPKKEHDMMVDRNKLIKDCVNRQLEIYLKQGYDRERALREAQRYCKELYGL